MRLSAMGDMTRFSVVTSVFSLLVLTAAAVAGPEYDRARRNSALARLALTAAERRLAEAEAEADRLDLAMDSVRDKQRDLDRQEDRLDRVKRELPDMLRDEEARLPRLDDQVTLAQAEVTKLSAPLREAIDQAKGTLSTVKGIRGKYVKQFEVSEPYQQAVAAAAAAAKHLGETHRAVLDRIHGSASYTAARAAHQRARVRQNALKTDGDATTADRVAAAGAVIETESAMVRIETEALAGDESLATARADARAADLTYQAVLKQFETDLPRQPDMAEALAEHDVAQRAAEEIDAAVAQRQKVLKEAADAAAGARTAIAEIKSQRVKVDAELAAARREAAALTDELTRLRRLLVANIETVAAARRDVDLADRRYRSAKAAESIAAQSGN